MNPILKQMNSQKLNGCCGSYKRKKEVVVKESILPNPTIKNGISIIYVGAGRTSFTGGVSQTIYHVSDHHRHFNIYKEDADSILKNKTVILKP